MRAAIVALLVAGAAGCAGPRPAARGAATAAAARATTVAAEAPSRGEPIGPGLWVGELADGVWRYVAQSDPAAAEPIDANGLIVRVGPQAILVDTGWNDAQAAALIDWAEHSLRLPVRAAIVTHFHADRAGGVEHCLASGLRVQMLDSTAARLGLAGRAGVLTFANQAEFPASARRLVVDWPGAGHTRDNIVVWIPDVKLLYGGCLLKATDWTHLGNLADADTRMYPVSVRALQRRYPDAAIVVPGHGDVGDARVLQHTLELAETHAR